MTDTTNTNTNTAHAAALAVRDAAAALARRRPLYDGASGEPADEDLAQAIEDLPLPDADATEALKEQAAEIARLRAENAAWREQCDTLTHQLICCGVAASHPDATLTTRGAYANKWDSAQAEGARKLRAERDELAARLAEIERLRGLLRREQQERHAVLDRLDAAIAEAAILRANNLWVAAPAQAAPVQGAVRLTDEQVAAAVTAVMDARREMHECYRFAPSVDLVMRAMREFEAAVLAANGLGDQQ